jgi:integration host factor subunit beta|tara:strand:+ start:6544 stop:6855 length:312 start_codon:yes stop_codon:yes gene_type:complete
MVKSELVQKLCDTHPNILHKDIKKIVEIIIFEMIEALCRNEAIEIRGWGRIKTVMRRARVGRNPKNSKTIQISEKKAIKWKMSKTLYNRLNENFAENKIFATN